MVKGMAKGMAKGIAKGTVKGMAKGPAAGALGPFASGSYGDAMGMGPAAGP
ncbi:hypothetical protein AB0C14_17850 [Microbispora hainanensis]|uniref:hypothetical protein n=1 Tax=Microbispora hainanensis TaxID=568844 RepID=UPI0033CE1B0E